MNTCNDCVHFETHQCLWYKLTKRNVKIHSLNPTECDGFVEISTIPDLTMPEMSWEHSHQTAYEMAKICQYTYKPILNPTYSISQKGIERVYHDEQNARILLLESDTHVVVSIQGSDPGFEDKKDWVHNIQHKLVWDTFEYRGVSYQHNIKVHEGFRKHLDLVWHHIENIDKPVAITGHSLGAGCRMIAYKRLEWLGKNPLHSYGFGEPRSLATGDQDSEYDKSTSYRNWGDIVTLLPKIGYTHYGNSYMFDKTGELTEGWSTFRRMKHAFEGDEHWPESPHDISTYEENLRRIEQ